MRVDFAHDAAGISDGDNIGGNVFCHDTACSRSSGRIGCPAVAIVTFLLTYQFFLGFGQFRQIVIAQHILINDLL